MDTTFSRHVSTSTITDNEYWYNEFQSAENRRDKAGVWIEELEKKFEAMADTSCDSLETVLDELKKAMNIYTTALLDIANAKNMLKNLASNST